jgi:hypothetical protein
LESAARRLRGILAALGDDGLEGTINDALSNGLLAALHDRIDELGNILAAEFRIRQNFTLGYVTTTGHALLSLFFGCRQLGLLRALGAVLGAGLLTVLDALKVEAAANDVVTHTRQVLHTAAANQNNRVLLQVVTLTADVRNDLETVGQTNLRNFTQRGVRLLRSRGVNTGANAPLLRACLERGNLALGNGRLPALRTS